jgi:cytochrome P450
VRAARSTLATMPSGLALLSSYEFFRDPYPTYRSLQSMGDTVWVDELAGWIVLDLAGCRRALSDHESFSSARARAMLEAMVSPLRFEELLPRLVCDAIEQDFLFLDPPRHSPIRRELAVALRSAMAELEPVLHEAARSLADALERTPRFDFMGGFSAKLPAIAMGTLLGLTPEQADEWQRWTWDAGPLFGASPVLADDDRRALMVRSVLALNESMAEHLFLSDSETPLLEHLRRLVRTRVWTPEEALGAAVQLYAAGVLTTGDALGMGVLELLAHPEQLARVESGAVPLEHAIEEIIRFTAPTQVMHRVVRQDTELGGARLRCGDLVYAAIGSAHRDPRGFERPDAFDVSRSDAARHIGFGAGAHRCIGLGLARLELRVGLEVIVPRLRGWKVVEPPRWRDYSMCFRGFDSLWIAAASGERQPTAA